MSKFKKGSFVKIKATKQRGVVKKIDPKTGNLIINTSDGVEVVAQDAVKLIRIVLSIWRLLKSIFGGNKND